MVVQGVVREVVREGCAGVVRGFGASNAYRGSKGCAPRVAQGFALCGRGRFSVAQGFTLVQLFV